MMVSPSTSTETIRNIGRSGDLSKRRKYDGIRRRTPTLIPEAPAEVYGRSTFSFLLAEELQRLHHAAELREAAQAGSLLASGAASEHIQDHGGGCQRAGRGGDSLFSARPDRRCAGGGQRFPERGCLLSIGNVVGLMAIRYGMETRSGARGTVLLWP